MVLRLIRTSGGRTRSSIVRRAVNLPRSAAPSLHITRRCFYISGMFHRTARDARPVEPTGSKNILNMKIRGLRPDWCLIVERHVLLWMGEGLISTSNGFLYKQTQTWSGLDELRFPQLNTKRLMLLVLLAVDDSHFDERPEHRRNARSC